MSAVPACPSCGRPVAAAQPRCLYCGASLPQEVVERARAAREALEAAERTARAALEAAVRPEPPSPPPPPDRVLIVLLVEDVEAERLAGALGLSAYEVGHLARRGGPHLHRILPPEAAGTEAARLRAAGLAVLEVPEAEVRGVEPVGARGGGPDGAALVLDTAEGGVRLQGADVSLVVLGPIAREYAPSTEVRRLRTATLEPGYRVHLHRRAFPRPIEIDPAAFDFGAGGAPLGAQRQVVAWTQQAFPEAPRDDSFRWVIPALAPAAPAAPGAEVLARRNDARPVLDNLAQFRFHSAWRAAVARRRAEAAHR